MMKEINKRFVLYYLLLLLSLFLLYFAAFKYQLGRHVKAEWWINNVCDYHDYVGSLVERPKIIIAGGSNALFGIDSSILKKITGYDVLNLSVHAGLDMNFLYHKIKDHIKSGDIVVLIPEFVYYSRNNISDWFTNNMMAWGEDHYLNKLSFFDLFSFLSNVREERVLEGLFQSKRIIRNVPKKEAVDQLCSLLKSKGPKWRGYSFKSLDKYGNINVKKRPTKSLRKLFDRGLPYLKKGHVISSHFLQYYSKLSALVEANQGKLILTWPVTIRNKMFDLSKLKYQKKVDNLKKRLATNGINICCNPALFNLDIKFFFNTFYHTNKFGGAIRSENLAYCLKRIIEYDSCDDISFKEAIQIVKKQEKKYIRAVFYVNKDTETYGGNRPCYSSIQAGINAAKTKTDIRIAEGTYYEPLVLNKPKELTLQGGWDFEFRHQVSYTIINSIKICNGRITADKIKLLKR